MSSARLIDPRDYNLVSKTVISTINKLVKNNAKLWFKYLDAKAVIDFLISHDATYIVDETYLVAYDIDVPWYSNELFLHELVVLKLKPGSSFDKVTSFLEGKRDEAGAKIIFSGTTLAEDDVKLASLYISQGFVQSAIGLMKEA